MVCSICEEMVFDDSGMDDFPNTILFFCRHAYHEKCLLEKDTSDSASAATTTTTTIHPGSVASKINHAALLRSTRDIGCPLCREQAAGGNAFVNRMKSQRRGPAATATSSSIASPRASSIRSISVAH